MLIYAFLGLFILSGVLPCWTGRAGTRSGCHRQGRDTIGMTPAGTGSRHWYYRQGRYTIGMSPAGTRSRPWYYRQGRDTIGCHRLVPGHDIGTTGRAGTQSGVTDWYRGMTWVTSVGPGNSPARHRKSTVFKSQENSHSPRYHIHWNDLLHVGYTTWLQTRPHTLMSV